MIRTVKVSDAADISRIYNHYISETVVTFEIDPISAAEMAERIADTLQQSLPWLVAEDETGSVIGYAYANKWKGRSAYRHSVEVTVYLDRFVTAKGWGTKLYHALFSALSGLAIHVAIGGISLPNQASIALHEKFGMKKVAHFEAVGCKFERWIDVGYWQVVLDA